MKLEDLVCPLWLAKKLPKDMETVFFWDTITPIDVIVRPRHGIDLNQIGYPAPTMQELIPLIENHPTLNLAEIVYAFSQELSHEGVTGRGWKYLETLFN